MMPPGLPPERTFVVVDISWWMNQALHIGGLESLLSTTIGRLANLLRGDVPWFLAVAADSVGPTWRHELTEGLRADWQYKGNRDPKPAEYHHVCNRVFEVIRLHRIPILYVEGYEADDAIAAAVDRAHAFDLTTVILSADKDLGQLCDAQTFLWDGKDRLRGASDIETDKKHPVPPRLIPDLLAIASDRGDNIPGVPDLGPTKAAALLRAYGSLRAALDATPEHVTDAAIKEAEKLWRNAKKNGDGESARTNLEILREKRDLAKWLVQLQEHRVAAELSLQLTTLDRSCPIAFDINELAIGGYDANALRKTYRALGFSQLANDVATFPKSLPDWMLPNADESAVDVPTIGKDVEYPFDSFDEAPVF
jgi:5'-3' exonuclease